MTKETTYSEPIPTEYKGVRFRSKSEAIFARAMDLAFPGDLFWEYEPKDFAIDWWVPDFHVIHPYSGDCLIEYKPSEVTETYKENLGSRFWVSMERHPRLYTYLFCGNHRSAERKYWSFDGSWQEDKTFWFWCEITIRFEEAAKYRFDLLQ